jgi:uncharacterized protein (DUF362 family)
MQNELQKCLKDSRVSAVKMVAEYPKLTDKEDDEIFRAIRQNAENLGWADEKRGAFGKVIKEGAKVLIKPNLVLHANQGSGGILPLVTHISLINAVVVEALKANPAQVIVGDAPVQGCRFDELLRVNGFDKWSAEMQNRDSRFKGIIDFRRTVSVFKNDVRQATENKVPLDQYVLYNLAEDSYLEPITDDKNSFRVTNYDPRLMAKTHSPGNHQYLVARHVIEADVVINLPKLKTHKKAGITNALKNLVGINGNKEYLPHHRLGGSASGGDCYPGNDLVKRSWEYIADQQNMTNSMTKGKILATVNHQLTRMMHLKGDKLGVEGSWSGNETVARMCLDLNRILLYGKTDATIADTIQRKVLHIVDAVIAGQGDGPLRPDALPMGLILAGENAAAMDWVCAYLLGYDAKKIPLTNYAFVDFRWRIARFEPEDIKLLGDWENVTPETLIDLARKQNVDFPFGWRNASANSEKML